MKLFILLGIVFCISICALVIGCLAYTRNYNQIKVVVFKPLDQNYSLPKIILNSTRKFQEKSTGRVCQFHGVNVVIKGSPWIPYPFNLVKQDNFEELFDQSIQTSYSLVKKDFELLQKYGINCIRLGVMMPGVYPDSKNSGESPYIIDTDYLDGIGTIITKAGQYGIYVVLDLHQDLLSSIFCGEGLPIWFGKKLLGSSPKHTWPYPLAGKYILSPLWRYLDNYLRKINKAGDVNQMDSIQTNCYKFNPKTKECTTLPAPETPNGPSVDKTKWWDAMVMDVGNPEAKTLAYVQKWADGDWKSYMNLPLKYCRKGVQIPLPLEGNPDIYGTNGCNWEDSSDRFTPDYPISSQCKCANSTPKNTDGQVLYGSWQLLEAFENLYKSENSEIIGKFWLDVLEYLEPMHSNILCIDIINEPLFGDAYQHIWKVLNANNSYLKPFYNTIISQIQNEYPNILISFEPITLTPPFLQFTKPPKGNNLIYNRHYYKINGKDPIKYLEKQFEWASKNNLGFILSEFNSPGYGNINFQKINSYCNENFIPWMYWEFKSFVASTCKSPSGSKKYCAPWNFGITGYGSGMFDSSKNCSNSCDINFKELPPLSQEITPNNSWKLLIPKYPIKVAGTNIIFTYEPIWKLAFTSLPNQTTEIFSPSSDNPLKIDHGDSIEPLIIFENNIYYITFKSSTNVIITF